MTTETNTLDRADLQARVKSMYRDVAEHPEGEFHFRMGRELCEDLGYDPAELDRIPQAAVASFAGVGCYFPLADLQPGETVLDLGSGSGTDAFIAALKVGENGTVLGVDMTDEQLAKATGLAAEAGFDNVSFKKGQIEQLPVADGTIDVVISNGVINLSPDKQDVFNEVARALRPGGRLVFADIVSEQRLPETVTCDASLWAACIGGAMQVDDCRSAIAQAGLELERIAENINYSFISDQAQRATGKYGVKSMSALARKSASDA